MPVVFEQCLLAGIEHAAGGAADRRPELGLLLGAEVERFFEGIEGFAFKLVHLDTGRCGIGERPALGDQAAQAEAGPEDRQQRHDNQENICAS